MGTHSAAMRAENLLDEKSADLWRHLWPEVFTDSVAHFGRFGCKSGGRLGSKVKVATPGPRHNTNSCSRLVWRTTRLRSCGAPRLFACSTDRCTTKKKLNCPTVKAKKNPSRDEVGHVRACALARVGKGGEGRGRRGRRGLRHNVFQWFCAPRDQRWQRSPKLRGSICHHLLS